MILRRQEILDFLTKKLMFWTHMLTITEIFLTDLDETWMKMTVVVVSKMGLSGLAVACRCLEIWLVKGVVERDLC